MSDGLPMLTFEADRTLLTDGQHGEVNILVGPQILANRYWPRGWPTPLQLERAIDGVESAIEQAKLRPAVRGVLRATESVLILLPGLLIPGAVTSRDTVEAAFSTLAAATHTSGYHVRAEASSGEGAAALLILRELMHHLGFQTLVGTEVVSGFEAISPPGG